jgi:hypothetical protein
MTDPAFIRWWRTQMTPPSPTPAQLRAWARRAWEAATERAAGVAEQWEPSMIDYAMADRLEQPAWDIAARRIAAAIRGGAHQLPTLPPTRGGSPRESRPAGNPGNPGV